MSASPASRASAITGASAAQTSLSVHRGLTAVDQALSLLADVGLRADSALGVTDDLLSTASDAIGSDRGVGRAPRPWF